MKKTSNSENLILQLFWNNKYQIACHEIYKGWVKRIPTTGKIVQSLFF